MDQAPSILVIDDDVNLTALMKRQLESIGFCVITAKNGKEGLGLLKMIIPSLIILDVNMPQLNGLDFFRSILNADGYPKYPVLVLTTRAEFEDTFKQANACGFIPKPFLIERLIAEVRRIIALGPRPIVFLLDYSASTVILELTRLVTKKNYEVIGVDDMTAFQKIAHIRRPQFILAEFGQQDMSGENLVKKIKNHDGFKDIPVVAYSFGKKQNFSPEISKISVFEFLENPRQAQEFITVIEKISNPTGKV